MARIITLLLLLSTAASAQFSLQNFRPAVDSKGYVTVDASQTLGHLDFSLGFIGSYAYRPLQLHAGGVDFAVDHLITTQLQAALGLFGGPRWRDRMHGISLQLGFTLPVGVMFGARAPTYVDPTTPKNDSPLSFGGQSVGDVGLNLKLRFLHQPVGLALLLAVDFPSGNSRQFLGEGQTSFRPTIILDKETRRFRVALNVGAIVRTHRHTFTDRGTELMLPTPICVPQQSDGTCGTGLSRSLGTQLTYSLGVAYGVVPQRFDLVGELFGAADLTGGNSGHPLELLAAAKVYLAQSSFFLIGAGAGALPPRVVDGRGNMTGLPEARVFLGFLFEPRIGDHARGGIEDEAPPPPPPPPPPSPTPEPSPEPPRTLVARHHNVIVTFDKIYFKTASAEILPRSFPLLDQLVALIQSNTDIQLLEIAGHADERGSDDYNLLLTQQRSQSVVTYLVQHGVDPLRLTAHGYGETQPAIDPQTDRPCRAHNEHCWEMNRRVEFRILNQTGE
jgi:outer membrane protein OmpA-like peptidoglycan-associated protein